MPKHNALHWNTVPISKNVKLNPDGTISPIDITKPFEYNPAPLPHPFKCSKCEYIATDKADFNDHWSLEH